MKILHPAGWPRPSGFSQGVVAEGTTIVLAGQIGWDPASDSIVEGFAAQVEQALRNIVMILKDAGAAPDDIVRLTWFVTDMQAYRSEPRAIGQGYRRVLGKHFPAMSVIGVSCLVEPAALVEIEAIATLR